MKEHSKAGTSRRMWESWEWRQEEVSSLNITSSHGTQTEISRIHLSTAAMRQLMAVIHLAISVIRQKQMLISGDRFSEVLPITPRAIPTRPFQQNE
jgi:hypothetical protein